MKKPLIKLIPLLAKGMVPTTAVASGLFASVALGGPGDLDPEFADVGRLGPLLDLDGPAWSLALDDNGILLAGGDFDWICEDHYCDWLPIGFEATNFVSRLTDGGSIDLSFDAAKLEDVQVLDVALQPDGKVVAVGQRVSSTSLEQHLLVFRLQREGPLDGTFGVGGVVELSAAEFGDENVGISLALDPDGRIVVAGIRVSSGGIVLRLLSNGALDNSFGSSGVFVGPFGSGRHYSDHASDVHIIRAGGGYRIASGDGNCNVVAVTASGELDNSFGTGGIAPVAAQSGAWRSCSTISAYPDGRLLVAGSADGHGFAVRLFASGAEDPDFVVDEVGDAFTDATALAIADDASVLIAGTGVNGAAIMRLQADGTLDALFGIAGKTTIDLPSENGTRTLVHDMAVRTDGSVLAAGGDHWSDRPFVVRLLGADGSSAPGVLGVTQQGVVETVEQAQEVVASVRRTGGSSGSVSVAYQTVAEGSRAATGGEDYVDVSGHLYWADGDTAEQQIRVRILANDPVEEFEFFSLMLSDVQGGAGLGTRNATFEILADGNPAGQFAIEPASLVVAEGQSATVNVLRPFYSAGAVSVTLSPIAGTATAGDDFAPEPVAVSWADGDSSQKLVEFVVHDDTIQESSESFTVELSNPTGGGVIGPQSSVTIMISASDQPAPPPPPPPLDRGGGGGTTGLITLLLLGAAKLLRWARISAWLAARNSSHWAPSARTAFREAVVRGGRPRIWTHRQIRTEPATNLGRTP